MIIDYIKKTLLFNSLIKTISRALPFDIVETLAILGALNKDIFTSPDTLKTIGEDATKLLTKFEKDIDTSWNYEITYNGDLIIKKEYKGVITKFVIQEELLAIPEIAEVNKIRQEILGSQYLLQKKKKHTMQFAHQN